jgi:N-acetylmuramoyl-L-alanine amidase
MRRRTLTLVERPSPNWGERPADAAVELLIVHYTGMPSAAAALERLTDRAAEVSAHYLIDEDGTVFHLVDENHRAWHAGVASWRGRGDVNSVSIGIELVNPGHEWGYRAFPPAQLAVCAGLARDIVARHAIRPWHVLGHSDVAPARKDDPGELFDWALMARRGVGLWPPDDKAPADPAATVELGARGPAVVAMQAALSEFGYACPGDGTFDEATRRVVVAFQRHFRPRAVDGRFDAECRRRLAWLLAQVD